MVFCVRSSALRRSRKDNSSAMSSVARASILSRRPRGSCAIFSVKVRLMSLLLPSCAPIQMSVKSFVSLANQIPIEAPLAYPRLIARNEQDRFLLGIEGECNSPHSIVRIEPQFLHVGVSRALQRIYSGPPCSRAKRLDYFRLGQQLVLYGFRQSIELGFELI